MPVFNPVAFVSVNMTAVWLIAFIVLLVIEGLVPGLVSIWFALGALAAMIAAILDAPIWLQVVWFLVISVVSLWLTRPLARKYLNSKTTPTNADMIIGMECLVKENIDNIQSTGAVSVGGKVWTARAEDPQRRYSVGERAHVVRIEGVKLIVR